ncbi:MAG: hypothetical protein ACK4OO_05150 [bacterium]
MDYSLMQRWGEDLHQMAVELAVVREKISTIEAHLERLQSRWERMEERVGEMEKRVASIRTVGITLFTLWSIFLSVINIWKRLVP